jgi:PAS domain S-box-containing protein
MALEGGRLRGLLQAQEFRKGGYASIIDGHGTIVARSTAHEEYVGRPVRDWLSSGARSGEAGLLRGVNHAGVETITAFRRLSGAPGWFVVVVEPLSSYHASLWPPIAALGLGSLGALALALVLALAIGGRILRPVGWLTRGAERIAASDGSDVTVPNDEPPSRVREFERLRAAVVQAHVTLRERASAVTAGEARLRAVVDTAVDAIVVIDQRGTMLSFNRAAEAIFGYTAAEAIGRNVSMLTGPEHSAKHDGYLAAYLRTGERKIIGIGQEVEGRRKDGTSVPLDLAIAEWRDAEGSRFFTGIMRDISARRADEARRALLMREVDHRAKNALAVVQSVLRLTRQEEPRAFVAAVEARVAALARAHSLLAQGGWSGADLRAVVERELAPYLPAHSSSAAQSATILLDGPPVALLPAAVQPLAMVLHELATNAAKHGALSVLGGAVEVRWWVLGQADEDGRLHLRWVETGGPAVSGIPSRRGFGMRLLEVTVRGQLGGSLSQHWGPMGLVCEITAPLQLVAAGSGMAGQSGAAAVASLSPA